MLMTPVVPFIALFVINPYDFTLESCPNGCEIEITPPEGDLIYCEICGIVYDSGRYRSCPNVARCSIVMFVASSLVFV